MKRELVGKAARNLLAVAMIAGLLPACSAAKTVTNFFGGGGDDIILPGQREPVIASTQEVEPDAELSGTPVVVPAAHTNPNWSQPGGVPSNSLQHVALGSQLDQAWSVSAGTGSSSQGRLTASPIVDNGRIFVLDTHATVHAFDASSGNRLWSKELTPDEEEEDEGFGGGVAADGSKVYITTAFGNVVALEPSSGQYVWGKRLDSPIRSAPTVASGQVFVTTINNEVYSLSAEDGFTLWRFDGIGESASLIASSSPAVEADTVVVPYTSGEIIGFSAADGRPLWGDSLVRTGVLSSLAALNDIAGRPVIEGGQAYAISHSGRMIAIDTDTGARVWSKNVSGTQTPWVAGDYLFVIVGNRTLMAMTRQDGLVRWSVELPSGSIWSGPVLAGGRLLAVSSNGVLAEIDVQSGEILAQTDVGEAMYISPVVAGNTIYLLTDDATLIAMR